MADKVIDIVEVLAQDLPPFKVPVEPQKPSKWIQERATDYFCKVAKEAGKPEFYMNGPSEWEKAILDYLDHNAQ